MLVDSPISRMQVEWLLWSVSVEELSADREILMFLLDFRTFTIIPQGKV